MGSLWCNLPDDLLRSIFSRITTVDQTRCSPVCKNWRRIIKNIRSINTLPWILQYNLKVGRRRVLSIYIPSDQQTYTLKYFFNPRIWSKFFAGAEACTSKNGWVLFKKIRGRTSNLLFAYSPFTNQFIELPELTMAMDVQKATFSSIPTSQSCLYFAYLRSDTINRSYNLVCSCHRGDTTWTTIQIQDYIRSLTDVVYLDGYFYCLCDQKLLGSINVFTREWTVVKGAFGSSYGGPYLMECGGQLFQVAQHEVGAWQIARFDSSTSTWIEEEGFKDQAVFRVSQCESTFVILAMGDASQLADGFVNPLFFDIMSNPLRKNDVICKYIEAYSRVLKEGLERVWIIPP